LQKAIRCLRGIQKEVIMPACMGYMIEADENPFATVAQDEP